MTSLLRRLVGMESDNTCTEHRCSEPVYFSDGNPQLCWVHVNRRLDRLAEAQEERSNPYTVHMGAVAPKPSGPSLLKRYFTP